MGRGLGSVQRATVAVVNANPDGITSEDIARHIHGDEPSPAQLESVRRAVRSLEHRGLVTVQPRRVRRPRRSLKRVFQLAGCEAGFCSACARRIRRMRLQDWHRRVMRDRAQSDPGWLEELAAAEASGFVHYAASAERVVLTEPDAVDHHRRLLRFVSPRVPDSAPRNL